MTEIPASYFDGVTSRPHAVTLRFHLDEGVLEVRGPLLELRVPRADVTIESRLGDGPRFIRFASGGRCEVTNNAALDAITAQWKPNRAAAWLHRIETSWPHVIAAVLILGFVGWAAVHFGLPWGARKIAFALPAGLTRELGEETLAALDKAFFEPSNLTHERQLGLQAEFKKFLAATRDTTAYRIEFRSAKKSLGANAVALPDGTIVITDELVLLAKDDQEIVGVLAHECGHIQHRHAVRGVLQNSAIFVMLTLVTGDVSSATAFGSALPAYLMQSRFSRDFEREADQHAIMQMRAAGRDPVHLATILERLGKSHGDSDSEMLAYLRTHPPTKERIEAIKTEKK